MTYTHICNYEHLILYHVMHIEINNKWYNHIDCRYIISQSDLLIICDSTSPTYKLILIT